LQSLQRPQSSRGMTVFSCFPGWRTQRAAH
jgi:hypothetical protein